jgi:hypothetical protein
MIALQVGCRPQCLIHCSDRNFFCMPTFCNLTCPIRTLHAPIVSDPLASRSSVFCPALSAGPGTDTRADNSGSNPAWTRPAVGEVAGKRLRDLTHHRRGGGTASSTSLTTAASVCRTKLPNERCAPSPLAASRGPSRDTNAAPSGACFELSHPLACAGIWRLVGIRSRKSLQNQPCD